MGLSRNKGGTNIIMRCDLCGRQTTRLRRVNGHWLNPKTNRKITDKPAWVCPTCKAKIARDGGKR